MHRFQFSALPLEAFRPLFELTDDELAARGARRVKVDEKPGFPCRMSLADAEVGESVLLLPYEHHTTDSPYRASGPIFVRETAAQANPAVGEVPAFLRHRLLSFRGYDTDGMMIRAEVAPGTEVEAVVDRFLAAPEVSYIHVHNARPGCYNCSVARVE